MDTSFEGANWLWGPLLIEATMSIHATGWSWWPSGWWEFGYGWRSADLACGM